ncbi:MAG TPA: bifunctional phosphopantothenoylcysteine decarboxylase/phosphopantothenate--cysteine ligase CoaBC [Planctomycetota bacterium]|nr:bifunctional phosphopantothenoylcysteine decarboxylase/phosphopantothenate--cysteine ligase CoaBC [Planctomycetota bacterium]
MKGRHIVLGVTGGIAAYKSADLTSKLVQAGAEVTVVMTESATRFVTPLTFETLSRRSVHVELWDADREFNPTHVALADWAEIVVVAPATANIIGKLANGIADDLLSTLLLSVDVPVVFAPAMNTRMWNNPVVQDNVRRLGELGHHIVEPGEGYLACGTTGKGRLADVQDIMGALSKLLE